MMKRVYFGNVSYVLSWIFMIFIVMAANRVDVKRFNVWQMRVWALKAEEGYRSWWYPDGVTPDGRRKYSIGLGWNDCGSRSRRQKIAKYTADRKVTYEEATEIAVHEIEKWGKLHSDPYVNLAMQLYSYNCGPIRSVSKLGKCHGGLNVRNKRCGHSDPDVRIAHNRRREYELALKNHDWIKIEQMTEDNRKKVVNIIRKLRK